MRRYLDFIGNIGLFALRTAQRMLVPPFEFQMILRQIEVTGWKSLPLVLSSGFALGLVLALHTRTTLVQFGAQGEMPAVQSLAFFNEIPVVDSLLDHVVIVEGYSGTGTPDQQFVTSRRRADLVREYLEAHFHLVHSDVGIVPLRDKPPHCAGRDTWNGVAVVLFDDRRK